MNPDHENRVRTDPGNEKSLPEFLASYEFIIPTNTSFKKVYRGAAEGYRENNR